MPLLSTPSDASSFYETSPLLASLRDLPSGLTADMRGFLANQLVRLLRDYYVHLPLKRSSLGIDPVQLADLLVDDVSLIPTDTEFFRRMFGILKPLRDRHTALRLPSPWRDMVAYLPFAVESYYDASGRHVVVSKLMADVGEPTFVEGVEITHWNGTAIGRFVEALSWTNEGSHPFARIAIALRSLTVRPLGYVGQPDEDWVNLTYTTADGALHGAVVPWRVYLPTMGSATATANVTASGAAVMVQGLDRNTLIVNNTWYDLYASRQSRGAAPAPIAPALGDNVRFKTVTTPSGEWGYIRIYSFDAADPASFVVGFADILRQVPQEGVIIDVRSNPGGAIPAGEGLLWLFTDRDVTPAQVSFRSNPATRRLGKLDSFSQWKRSLDMLYETGEAFSQGFPLTLPQAGVQGVYKGHVVLIIDALCYSTTDFFAAGMQDNGLATIIGVDPVTGAGGANVWNQVALSQFVAQSGGRDVLQMPSNIDIDISIRRSIRVGPNAGLPLEGLGVFADLLYYLTRDDVMGDNADLINFAGKVLSDRKG
jgi:Peptidase family S41